MGDEFKPEDDFRPDTSDRRPARRRSNQTTFALPKVAISRQYIMIGTGILVLLILIVSIGSALKTPTSHDSTESQTEKSVNLPGSTSLANVSSGSGHAPQPDGFSGKVPEPAQGASTSAAPDQGTQQLSAPPVSSTPTQAPIPPPPVGQQRVDLPGNIVDALSTPGQQQQVDSLSSGMSGNAASTLPTAPATLLSSLKEGARQENRTTTSGVTHTNSKPVVQSVHAQTPAHSKNNSAHEGNQVKPRAVAKASEHTAKHQPVPVAKPAHHVTTIEKTVAVTPKNAHASAPSVAAGNRYTLQLSSSSRSDSLKTFAQQQGLTHFQVYETKREGKPWYILTSGSYATSTEAKNAISKLPASIQEKKPWARPLSQVKQDIKK